MNFDKIEVGKNTTITVLMTNLKLDSDELKQMAHQVNASMGIMIRPFNTLFDGDIFYSCSTETLTKPKNFNSSKLLYIFNLPFIAHN